MEFRKMVMITLYAKQKKILKQALNMLKVLEENAIKLSELLGNLSE